MKIISTASYGNARYSNWFEHTTHVLPRALSAFDREARGNGYALSDIWREPGQVVLAYVGVNLDSRMSGPFTVRFRAQK